RIATRLPSSPMSAPFLGEPVAPTCNDRMTDLRRTRQGLQVRAESSIEFKMNAQVKSTRAQERNQSGLEDQLVAQAEALIVRGKEQGPLSPDEILEGFPDMVAEPDDLFRLFRAFEEMGIPVSDAERELDEADEGDQEVALAMEAMEMTAIDDPVRM